MWQTFPHFSLFPFPPPGNPLPSVLLSFGSFSLIDCENNVLCCAADRESETGREKRSRTEAFRNVSEMLFCHNVIYCFAYSPPPGPLLHRRRPKSSFLLCTKIFSLNGVSKVLLGEGLNAWVIFFFSHSVPLFFPPFTFSFRLSSFIHRVRGTLVFGGGVVCF